MGSLRMKSEGAEMYRDKYIASTYRIKDHTDRRGYLRLDMNENPEGLPEDFVRETVKKITPEFLASYPQKDNLLGLIAGREGVDVQNVTLTNGSDEGMRLVFETFTHAGGRVLTVTPTFEMYQVYASMFGVELDTVPFKEDFTIETEELLGAIKEDTNLVVLLNPNSPIGTEFTEEEFERIVAKAEAVGAVVLVDEAYYPFGVESKVAYCRKHPHVMVMRTFSKWCSLAALRVGYLIGSEECIHLIENAQSTYNVNSVGILFAEELLKREDILDMLRQSMEEGRNYLVSKLESAGYSYYAAKGNYILIKPKKAPQLIAEGLKEEHILIKTYRKGMLAGWLRITLGSRKIMERFWEGFFRMEERDS